MNEIGLERFRIDMIEDYPCNDEYKLAQREGFHIRQLGTLNKQIAGRTDKQYFIDNKINILSKQKKNYEQNKDSYKVHQKEYYNDNKEKILKYHKEYDEKNKQKIQEYQKVKILCECGCTIRKVELPRHLKSQKHIKFIEQKQN